MPSLNGLAAAQTIPVAGDVARNTQAHERTARVAAELGAGLVVFPELSLTGYEVERAPALGFTVDDPRLEPIAGIAASLGITLVVGAPVRLGGRLHIGSFAVPAAGSPVLYTKRRLGAFAPAANPGGRVPPPEGDVFDPGDRDPLIRDGDRTAALAICADTGDPAHARAAAERGANTYLASMFIVPGDFAAEARSLAASAAEHRMAVVLANFGGPTGGLPSAGQSSIWSDRGELLARLDREGAGVAVALRDGGTWTAVTRMLGPR